MRARGFSLIELLLVIALLAIVSLSVFPYGVTLYRTQVLKDTHGSLAASLRQAQMYALTQKGDTNHGVKLLADSYVVFEGDSYATRDEAVDQVVMWAPPVTVSGLEEVVFARSSGLPSATGTITLTVETESLALQILPAGLTQ